MLIAFEGLDGSGKSTQIRKLADTLKEASVCRLYNGRYITEQFLRLNSLKLIGPIEASLMTAAELAGRFELDLSKRLRNGDVVIFDKFVAGARSRDAVRQVPAEVLDAIYGVLPDPDLYISLDISPQEALTRKLRERGPGIWESGLDLLGLGSPCEIEAALTAGKIKQDFVCAAFVEFQSKVAKQYESELAQHITVRVNAAAPIDSVCENVMTAILVRFPEFNR
jgi:dTMP kinase